MKTKTCTGPCGETKLLDEFSRHRRASDGYMNICKVCHVEKCRAREVRRLTAQYERNLARQSKSKAKPVKMPNEPEPVPDIKPSCNCKRRFVFDRGRRYVVHAASCTVFRHNQLDSVRRSSSLDDEAMKFGGW